MAERIEQIEGPVYYETVAEKRLQQSVDEVGRHLLAVFGDVRFKLDGLIHRVARIAFMAGLDEGFSQGVAAEAARAAAKPDATEPGAIAAQLQPASE